MTNIFRNVFLGKEKIVYDKINEIILHIILID